MKAVILSLLLLPLSAYGQDNKNLKWSEERKLKFTDFLCKPDANSRFSAISASQINYYYHIDYDTLEYNIFSFFQRERAWIKITDTTLLAHEQLHFDIAELYSRKIKKRIVALSGQEVSDSLIYEVFLEERLNSVFVDSLFDAETAHGKINEISATWTEKINRMLDSLEEFKRPNGKIFITPR